MTDRPTSERRVVRVHHVGDRPGLWAHRLLREAACAGCARPLSRGDLVTRGTPGLFCGTCRAVHLMGRPVPGCAECADLEHQLGNWRTDPAWLPERRRGALAEALDAGVGRRDWRAHVYG